MKRHPGLQQLSREHHHSLVLARRARRWATQEAQAREHGWDLIREAYRRELLPHFTEEETRLLPLLGADSELVTRTLDEHAQLRRLALDGSTGLELHELGSLLEAHIRFEERVLFPSLERLLEVAG